MWTDFVIIALLVINLALLLFSVFRRKGDDGSLEAIAHSSERVERSVREEFGRNREETSTASRELRAELTAAVQSFGSLVLERMGDTSQLQQSSFEGFARQLAAMVASNEEKLEAIRTAVTRQLGELKTDAGQQHAAAREELARSMKTLGEGLSVRMLEIATNFTTLSQGYEKKLEAVRETVERKLGELQQDNTSKLEQMRATVDEKLHATLEQRLGESFKIVSDRLELVHAGLGEMRTLAIGVGDLKKVLTNIKTRGGWGEVQLGNLLAEIFTPDQYERNVAPNPESNERVEYAVKLPGKEEHGAPVWLPIDAKFPQEEYQRLVDAQERGDAEAAEAASAALEAGVRGEAKKISTKYLNPPHTTDFAILFLPTEGLFAEVLRRPGLCDGIQRDLRVMLSGPTTLAAMLTSLQMGFRTLAIEKRSSEVWNVLAAVKTEFGKFGVALDKVHKKLNEASNSIEEASRRSRAMEKKLRTAAELPTAEAAKLLELNLLAGSVADEELQDDEP